MRPSADMFNLQIHMQSRKKREYLQNGSSNPSGKWCNRIFGSFLHRKQLYIFLVRADHPKVPLPPPPPPKITTVDRDRLSTREKDRDRQSTREKDRDRQSTKEKERDRESTREKDRDRQSTREKDRDR